MIMFHMRVHLTGGPTPVYGSDVHAQVRGISRERAPTSGGSVWGRAGQLPVQ